MREGDKVRYIYELSTNSAGRFNGYTVNIDNQDMGCIDGWVDKIEGGVIRVIIKDALRVNVMEFNANTLKTLPHYSGGRLEFVSALSWDKLYLFVWTDFHLDFYPECKGLAVAIAHNEYEAMRFIFQKLGYNPDEYGQKFGYDPDEWGELVRHDYTSPIAYVYL